MQLDINSPKFNDNRSFDYSKTFFEEREEYDIISGIINPNSKVIDLGCGNGSLLVKLKSEKNIIEYGMEISPSGVEVCRQKGLNVLQGRIDEMLPFKDDEFEYSICNVTIQMVMYPEILLKEMKRISKYQIISFPNFAFYKSRLDLFFKGRKPKPMLFGYEWYNTGHIHLFSIKDFIRLIEKERDLKILELRFVKTGNRIKDLIIGTFPNLFSIIPIYLIKKVNV